MNKEKLLSSSKQDVVIAWLCLLFSAKMMWHCDGCPRTKAASATTDHFHQISPFLSNRILAIFKKQKECYRVYCIWRHTRYKNICVEEWALFWNYQILPSQLLQVYILFSNPACKSCNKSMLGNYVRFCTIGCRHLDWFKPPSIWLNDSDIK